MAKDFNVAVKWRNFAKSGHTGCLLVDWRPPHFIFPVNKIELFCRVWNRIAFSCLLETSNFLRLFSLKTEQRKRYFDLIGRCLSWEKLLSVLWENNFLCSWLRLHLQVSSGKKSQTEQTFCSWCYKAHLDFPMSWKIKNRLF